tara:strand:+ start:1291 stop:1743 length:453 start_codon:yes stop_codon:yes gene_type:complete
MNIKKEVVYEKIQEKIDQRIKKIHQAIRLQKESLQTASESTAGDKHNTSRAMMHIEEEKLNNQLVQLLQLKKLINKINPTAKKLSVTLGSLVKTNHGWLHISVPLGNLKIDETNIMVVSLVSPIGQILQNKNAGESVQFNGKKWKILRVL